MANLKTMQQYAEKCAERLGVIDKIVLRWSTKDCPIQHNDAHCHVKDDKYRQGTICVNRAYMGKGCPIGYWHSTIAHEVTHLAVKSSHSSSAFAKRMLLLGQASYGEKQLARVGKKHRHIDSSIYYQNGRRLYTTCRICHRKKYY